MFASNTESADGDSAEEGDSSPTQYILWPIDLNRRHPNEHIYRGRNEHFPPSSLHKVGPVESQQSSSFPQPLQEQTILKLNLPYYN